MLLEIRRPHRAIGGETFENELAKAGPSRHPGRSCSLIQPGRRQRELKGAVRGRNDRRLMGPVLVETALVPQQDVDQLGVERTEAAEDDQQVAAGHDRGWVELQAADRPHQRVDVVSRDRFRA